MQIPFYVKDAFLDTKRLSEKSFGPRLHLLLKITLSRLFVSRGLCSRLEHKPRETKTRRCTLCHCSSQIWGRSDCHKHHGPYVTRRCRERV